MKISLNWLKDYVETGISAEALAYKLTMAGLEVEKSYSAQGDTVLEMEITPNRPDCLNVLGIAREVSAICNKQLVLPKETKINFPKKKCDISILDDKGCSRYIGTLIENVNIKVAPKDIKSKIEALGIRSINNVVDITNFTLMENGQPLHAFDYDKLIGGKIIVRRAKKGEKIITIDEEERELDPSILVIADQKRPVAIAGIMGGKETEVTSKTKNILLESAYFDPILIRRASRKIGLSSDSSYRFERGVDYDTVSVGCNRAISLILKEAKGTISARTDLVASKISAKNKAIMIGLDSINSFLGSSLKLSQCKTILQKLNCSVSGTGKNILKVVPPKNRQDLKEAVDLMEEIARIVGYNNLPMSMPLIKATNVSVDQDIETKKKMRDCLIAQGMSEAITYTMIGKDIIGRAKSDVYKAMKVLNPLTQDQEYMRPTLLPSLLSVVRTNINKGQKNLKIFELAKVYTASGERETLGIILTGDAGLDWRKDISNVDFYDAKGVVEEAFSFLGIGDVAFEESQDARLEKGQRADILFKKKLIGVVGKVNEDILNACDIKQNNVLFAEVDIESLLGKKQSLKRYKPVFEYPAVTRDVSLCVNKDITFDQIKKVALECGDELLSEIYFTEEYLGEKIPAGKRGIVFSLVYQIPSRTLTEEEVNKVHEKTCETLVASLGATIR